MAKYHGIIVPAVTPLATPVTVDTEAVKTFFDFLISGGVSGIFILGSTGEGPALTETEQKKYIEASVQAIAGRCPLLVGISGASGAAAIDMGKFALAAGADALVAAVPCYLPAENDDEIVNYYSVLAKFFPERLFVYNMPAMTKISFTPELAVRLLQIPGVAGYKDSAGIFENFRKVVESARCLHKDIFIGPEHLTADAIAIGAQGGVNGGANVMPELFSALAKAAEAHDMEKVAVLQKEVIELQSIYGTPCTTTGVIRGLKRKLAGMGMIENITAFPNLPLMD